MEARKFQFWANWLFWANVMTVGVGILAAVWGTCPALRPWNEGIDATFGAGADLPLKHWLMGVLGGTIAGFHVLMAFIARIPFLRRERWAWQACTIGLITWFCIDSSVSAYYGAWFNIYLINLFALAAIGLPLVVTARTFRKP